MKRQQEIVKEERIKTDIPGKGENMACGISDSNWNGVMTTKSILSLQTTI